MLAKLFIDIEKFIYNVKSYSFEHFWIFQPESNLFRIVFEIWHFSLQYRNFGAVNLGFGESNLDFGARNLGLGGRNLVFEIGTQASEKISELSLYGFGARDGFGAKS